MKLTKILMLLVLSFGLRLEAKDTGPKTPKEFIKGKLDQGQVWDHPFTMFNRNRDNSFNWQDDVNLLRNEVIKFDGIKEEDIETQTSYAFQMYKQLLDFASGGEPGLCAHDVDACSHPHWVKANAFITCSAACHWLNFGRPTQISVDVFWYYGDVIYYSVDLCRSPLMYFGITEM